VADPDGDYELGGVADEPRVTVVLGRPGLAGLRPAVRERAAPPGPLADHALEQRVDDGGVVRAERGHANRLVRLAVDGDDRARVVVEDRAVDAEAAVREPRVRPRHLERAH